MGTEQVPAGVYTRQSLALMAGDTDFPSGFADSVLANVVTNETSVRAVAQKVALGEVDAGFVYQTDASAGQFSTMFRVIDIPGHLNVAVQYPIATVAAGAQRRIAADYVEFVLGAEGRAILLQHGFGAPSTAECPCADADSGVMESWVSVIR
jgi:molybdate transport system substrate-binding protein